MIALSTLDSGHAPSLAALHAEKPLRVWSLIVTIFGDVVMERGARARPPTIWIAPLLELLALLGVDGALARTNLSRLVANGTLERSKSGRNTFYRLSQTSRAEFARAAGIIYAPQPAAPAQGLHLVLLDRCKDRAKARDALLRQGFVIAAPTLAVRPARGAAPSLPRGALLADAAATAEWREAAADLWHLPALNAAARRLLRGFAALVSDAALTPAQAITARIALVHLYRRIALRDPGLPEALLPPDWALPRATALFAEANARLQAPSERWLAQAGFYRQPDA